MDSRIKAYAKLLIKTGLDVRPGQYLVITCPVDCAYFARMCATEAYNAGCKEVIMNWTDDYLTREKYLRADDSIFDEVPSWKVDMYNTLTEKQCAWLHIDADDPEALAGVDTDKIRRSAVASGKALKEYRDRQMSNFFPWCIGAIPSAAWAKKVFPEMTEEDAINALWEQIFASVRVYKDGDPVAEWEKHNANLTSRMDILNKYNFKHLKYKNSLGTDLTIELPENHIWLGGAEKCAAGYEFNANMPTEEVFTAPKRDGVNGIVYASKPLVVNGDIADKFSFTFENGKIVKICAEKGQKLLETAVATDEGSAYLGEVALVPYDSPISNSGVLFYNTLFDENASCHLAFGDAYPCVVGGNDMSREELAALGINSSIMHEDFMVGTADLSIIGITHDGEEIPVFVDGNFAF